MEFISNQLSELNVNNLNLSPGSKFKVINDDTIYILLGNSSDINNIICVKENNNNNNHNQYIFSKNNISEIIYKSQNIIKTKYLFN